MKLIPPPAASGSRERLGAVHARKAAIEAAQRPYVPLICGHLTTTDIDLAYRVFKGSFTPRDHLYCEDCCDWKKPVRHVKTEEIPAEPLF